MKIALVIDCLDPRRGGAEQWTFQHAQGLLARGHEVHVVTQGISGPAAALDIVPHLLDPVRNVLQKAAAAEAALRSLHVDVVHDIGLGWHSDMIQSEDGSRLAQWEQKLLVLPPWQRPWKRAMLRTLPRYRDFRRLMERQFGDPERTVIAVSQMCANHYQHYHDVPTERIRLVHHGVDNERFSPAHRARWRDEIRNRLHLCDDEVVLLFVGHDYQRKGLSTAVRAARRLAAEGALVRLLVVGGNGRWHSASPASPDSLAIHVGAAEDTVPYYAAADVFVLPTFYDPCSLSVSEAAASGLPSVTSRFNGAAELLTEGVDGSIVSDPADDAELAAALRPLLEAETRRRMGDAARKIAENYTLDRNCDEFVSIYQQIADRGRPRLRFNDETASKRDCRRRAHAEATHFPHGSGAMKIALVIDYMDPRRGGAEHWTFQHAQRLLERGHEVHIVAQGIGGPAAELDVVPHLLGPIRNVLKKAVAAEAVLRRLDVDIIHDIGLGWYNDVFQSSDGSRMAQWEQKLLVLPPWQRPWKRAMLRTLPRYHDFRRLMARQFDGSSRIVLAISQMCARDFQHYHAVPPDKIRLIYHGVDCRQFSPDGCQRRRDPVRRQMGIREDETVFLFVGHDYRRKGLATAVRAIDRLAAQGRPARLVVVGGKRHDRLPCRPERAAMTVVGAADDPTPYYAAADAVVLPTFYDPFGLVVLEAAACGLPVITTRMAGASELFRDGRDGFVLADPANDVALAARMWRLLDPAVRRQMGDEARKVAAAHTAERCCDEIISVYREISTQRRRAA